MSHRDRIDSVAAAALAGDGWLRWWIEVGVREFETYLGKHRRFDDYYTRRDGRNAT